MTVRESITTSEEEGTCTGQAQGQEHEPERTEQNEQMGSDGEQSVRPCPECKSGTLAEKSGELVCIGCGLVVDGTQIDRGPDWRAFNQNERDAKSRGGVATTETMHDKGLTTQIGWQDKDAYGNAITGERRKQLYRLRKWQEQTRTRDSSERNLKFALGEIDRMASALGIPQEVQEIASVIYRRCLDNDLIRGRSIEGVTTGSLYAASRQQGIARSLDEMETVSRVEYQEIARTYRYLARELNLKIEPAMPKSYLPRFASELDLSRETTRKAEELLEAARKDGVMSGKSPPGLAASALYGASIICDERRTQPEISDVAQVSVVTIRNRYKEMFEAMGLVSM